MRIERLLSEAGRGARKSRRPTRSKREGSARGGEARTARHTRKTEGECIGRGEGGKGVESLWRWRRKARSKPTASLKRLTLAARLGGTSFRRSLMKKPPRSYLKRSTSLEISARRCWNSRSRRFCRKL